MRAVSSNNMKGSLPEDYLLPDNYSKQRDAFVAANGVAFVIQNLKTVDSKYSHLW